MPGQVVQGREAIRAEIELQREFSTFMECGIVKLVSAGLTVMTERLDYFTMHGVRVSHALVAVYDLDAEGKILSWREYFDTADLGKQLGMQPERSEEHTSELQSLMRISYAVFCLKKKN